MLNSPAQDLSVQVLCLADPTSILVKARELILLLAEFQ